MSNEKQTLSPKQIAFLDKFGALARDFKAQVFSRAAEVDPSNEQDWFSMQIGFALGRGLNSDEAHDFATMLRYHFGDGGGVPD